MLPEKTNSIYRHFKGGYYLLRTLATTEGSGDTVAVYESLTTHEVWTRPLAEFYDDVSEKEGNVTGQKHRFELVQQMDYQLSLIPTDYLMQELLSRPDCPAELKTLDPDKVWRVEYLIGRFRTTFIDAHTSKEDFYFDKCTSTYELAVEALKKMNDPRLQILMRVHIKQDFD